MSRHASSLRVKDKRARGLISGRRRDDYVCSPGDDKAVDNLGDGVDRDQANGWPIEKTLAEAAGCARLKNTKRSTANLKMAQINLTVGKTANGRRSVIERNVLQV